MPDEKNKLADELARFEDDVRADDDGNDESVDLDRGDAIEDPTEGSVDDDSGQVADSDSSVEDDDGSQDASSQDDGSAGGDDAADQPQFLTTLPDDKDAFGELAGQKVTAQQIIEAGLMEKFASWGHQGRHLVQKGQKDLEEAKAAKSETERLIELLENRFKQEDVAAAKATAPKVTEEQFAQELVRGYLPSLKAIADQGGIETDFLKEFPKAAVQMEHRFQSGAELIQGLIKEVSDLREYIGMKKEAEAEQTATAVFEGLLDSVAEQGDLFSNLGDGGVRKAFTDFLTDDNTHLRITQKEVKDITAEDVASAWLFFAHKHPEFLKAEEDTTEQKREQARMAGSSSGKKPSIKTKKQLDEFERFQREYADSVENSYDV